MRRTSSQRILLFIFGMFKRFGGLFQVDQELEIPFHLIPYSGLVVSLCHFVMILENAKKGVK